MHASELSPRQCSRPDKTWRQNSHSSGQCYVNQRDNRSREDGHGGAGQVPATHTCWASRELRQEGEASQTSPPLDGQEAGRQKEFDVPWKSGILFNSIVSEITGYNLCGFLSKQSSSYFWQVDFLVGLIIRRAESAGNKYCWQLGHPSE